MRKSATTLESELKPAELECLKTLLRDNTLAGKHLEIGTAAGGTLWEMMSVYPDATRPQFVVIDPMTYFEDQYGKVCRNLSSHGLDPASVDFRRMTSIEALGEAVARDERFDFIFIDGNHKLKYVTADLQWAALLNPGGLLLMHDYHPNYIDVVIAAKRFLARNGNYRVEKAVETLLVVRKLEASKRREVTELQKAVAAVQTVYLQLRRSVLKRLSS